jgi:hypothetical protein
MRRFGLVMAVMLGVAGCAQAQSYAIRALGEVTSGAAVVWADASGKFVRSGSQDIADILERLDALEAHTNDTIADVLARGGDANGGSITNLSVVQTVSGETFFRVSGANVESYGGQFNIYADSNFVQRIAISNVGIFRTILPGGEMELLDGIWTETPFSWWGYSHPGISNYVQSVIDSQ